MKKLFTVLIISLACIFMSCGVNDFSKTEGSVTFEIPAEQLNFIIQQVNNQTQNPYIVVDYMLLVQVSGSRGYYKREVRNFSKDMFYGDTAPQDDYSFADGLIFPFPKLPTNQTYTVMLDLYRKEKRPNHPDMSSSPYSVVATAQTLNVIVKPRSETEVPLVLKIKNSSTQNSESSVLIKYTYQGPSGTVAETLDPNEISEGTSQVEFAKVGKKYYVKKDGHSYELSAFEVVLKDDSHLKKADKIWVQKSHYENNKEIIETVAFVNGAANIADLTITGNNSFEIIASVNGYDIMCGSIWFTISSLDSMYTIKEFKGNNALEFKTNSDDLFRFYAVLPLESSLGLKNLNKGDTVVFRLNTPFASSSPLYVESDSRRFYYIFTSRTALESSQEQWADNVCISYQKPYDESQLQFIMPANFVEGNEKSLVLFFDVDKAGQGVTNLKLEMTISYVVFPADQKVYVLRTEKDDNYGNTRREMNIKLEKYLSDGLAGGDTVKVKVKGLVGSDKAESEYYNIEFNAELYDNVKDDDLLPEQQYYYPMSQDYIQIANTSVPNGNNCKSQWVEESELKQTFVFASILAPVDLTGNNPSVYSTAHD